MIYIDDIKKSYGSKENKTQVLQGISLQIQDQDFTVIFRCSGSGKSTLLNIISGLERPDSGSVKYETVDITQLSDAELTAFRKKNIGFVFQQYYLLPNMTVEQNVRMGADLANNRNYRELISAVGLGDKLKNTQASFQAASSKEQPLHGACQKAQGIIFR